VSNDDLVLVEERDAYALIRINRHDKRNAMNEAARKALMEALDQIRGRFKVAVLTGAETSFCSGIDLKEAHAAREKDLPSDPKYAWAEVNLAIRAHPAIFIAAVNGIALGGGATLINVCDLAIAAEEAQIGMPEMSFATYPGLAGPTTQFSLPRKRAAWMILTTKRIDGATAERWGMVNQVVPRAELLNVADEIARRIAQFDATALTESKHALDKLPVVVDWRASFDFGQEVIGRIRSSTNAASEGLEKFNRGERLAGQGTTGA
jgi:enoyl-CoA hydratase/carnithine racemase